MSLRPVASIQHTNPQHHIRIHPTKNLLATINATCALAHIWTWESAEFYLLGTVGDKENHRVARYQSGWYEQGHIDVAWHPAEPVLATASVQGVQTWDCSNNRVKMVSQVSTVQTSHVAFTPDGKAMWATPSSGGKGIWITEQSPKTDYWAWDTDLAVHPEGQLMAGFSSDQGATLIKFSCVVNDQHDRTLQTFRRALVMDVDGYEGLVFNAQGDRFLFRGNNYENVGYLHEFPSLRCLRVIPFETRDTIESRLPRLWHELGWSHRENLCFSPNGEKILMGLTSGHLVEIDSSSGHALVANKIMNRAICSLRTRDSDGLLAVTDFEGSIQLYLLPVAEKKPCVNKTLTHEYLASTQPTSAVADWGELSLTDGFRDWPENDIVGEALPESAPTWAQIGAVVKQTTKTYCA